MRLSIFLLLLTLTTFTAHASENYFEILPKSNVLNSKNELEINFEYDLKAIPEERFRIRPVISAGSIFESFLNWSGLPSLSPDIKFNVLGLSTSPAEVYFQIQDIKTTKIYETAKRKIWGNEVVKDYVRRLNETILNGKILE